MLPRLQRLGRPLIMQPVWRGDVHKVNFRVIEQIFIGAVGFSEFVLLFCFLGCGEVARGDGVEDYGGVGFGGVDYFSDYQYINRDTSYLDGEVLTSSSVDLRRGDYSHFQRFGGFAGCWVEAGVDVLVEECECLDYEGHVAFVEMYKLLYKE